MIFGVLSLRLCRALAYSCLCKLYDQFCSVWIYHTHIRSLVCLPSFCLLWWVKLYEVYKFFVLMLENISIYVLIVLFHEWTHLLFFRRIFIGTLINFLYLSLGSGGLQGDVYLIFYNFLFLFHINFVYFKFL